jgi:hypothetical protein
MGPYLTRKELAAALGHSRWYVWAMEKAGFAMIGGRAKLESALDWLMQRPRFRASRNICQHPPTSANIRKHRKR